MLMKTDKTVKKQAVPLISTSRIFLTVVNKCLITVGKPTLGVWW